MGLPRVLIDLNKLTHNVQRLNGRAQAAGIKLTGVVKGLAGDHRTIKAIIDGGITEIGDSRLENLERVKGIKSVRKVMLRLPSLAQIDSVAALTDCSLNAEQESIRRLDAAASRGIHEIILMIDLGDRREGILAEGLFELCRFCKRLQHIKVLGLGTNFACFGGAIPTAPKFQQLLALAAMVRQELRLPIEVISGGNSSSLPLLYDGSMPRGINNLRVGEALLLGRETLAGNDLPDLYQDIFVIEAEVVQSQFKPNQAEGPVGRDAFGRIPRLPELEAGPRMLLNIGQQDTDLNGLRPLNPDLRVLGGSSDYLVLAGEKVLTVGSRVAFIPNYWGLLAAMTSPYVAKEYR